MHPLDALHPQTPWRELPGSPRALARRESDQSAEEAWWRGVRGAGRPAGTWISWPGSCSSRGRASTRSARPGTRATRWSRTALRPTDPALLHYRSGGVLRRPGPAGAGLDAGPRRAAGADGAGRRADRRRPAQGVRASRPGDHPADLDHRLAPAARGRAGDRPAPRPPAGRGLRVAGGRGGGLLVRGRLGQPLDGGRRDQHRDQRRLPRPAGADPVRLRGQRAGASRCRPRRAGSRPRTDPAPGLGYVSARRRRSGRGPSGDHRGRAPGTRASAGRSSCTCGRSGSSATPAATPRSATARRARSRPTTTGIRCWPRRRCCAAAGAEPASRSVPGTTQIRAEIDAEVDALRDQRRLGSAAEVMAPIAPAPSGSGRRDGGRAARRRSTIKPRTLAESINATLERPARPRDRRVIVFGEDVGVKGGVYGVTGGLARRHGAARVFDTILDEQSILGLGLGAGSGRSDPDPGDPVPRLPAQRRRPTPRRGGHAAVLLPGPVQQSDGGPGRRTGVPEGIRRPLPQRQRGRRAARHPGTGRRLPGPRRRRRRRCSGPAWPRRPPMRRCRCSWSRSPCTTGAICTSPATAAGSPLIMVSTCRSVARAATTALRQAQGTSRQARNRFDHDHLRQRRADEPAGRAPAGRRRASPPTCSICAGSPRCRRRRAGRGPAYRAGAGGRRDPAHRRRRRGRDHRAGRGWFAGPIARVSSQDSFVPLGAAAQHVLLGEDEIEKAAITLAGMGDR